MPVGGDHKIAEKLGAVEIVRQADFNDVILRTDRHILTRLARAVDQLDRGRRDGFVESQAYCLRSLRHHAAVAGLGRNQGRVCEGAGGEAKNRQQGCKARDEAQQADQGFAISLTPGAVDLLPCVCSASPSAGISIQRLTPCSHSCTVGKYSTVSGLRAGARYVLMTNSS